MKRLIALLAALCCLAALLTPVWAVQDEGTGADTGETGTAATDTGDTAEDPDASGEGGEDATDSAASDSETDQETDPEADQAADAETDSETGSDPAALTETAFQSVTITCTVDESGRAYFQETLELSIVGSVQEIAFTFPAEAKSPKVDGYKTKSSTENGVRVLTVSNDAGFTGVQTFQLSFNQTGLVTAGEASQTIRLPLLSPQAYPIAAVSFSVTFPENFSSTPSFESGYYKDVIEDMMTVSTSGGVVTGITNKGTVLNDNETLTMSLTLPEGYFSGNFGMLAGGLCELILVCWVLKPDFLSDHANRISDFKIGSVWKFCVSALTPLVLIVMLSANIAGLFSSSLPNYGGYPSAALFVFGWLMMAILVLLAAVAQKFSAKRTKETLLHIWEEFSDGKGGKP